MKPHTVQAGYDKGVKPYLNSCSVNVSNEPFEYLEALVVLGQQEFALEFAKKRAISPTKLKELDDFLKEVALETAKYVLEKITKDVILDKRPEAVFDLRPLAHTN